MVEIISFTTRPNPTPPENYVPTTMTQFVEDFYVCQFDIPARDMLPPYIHYLILAITPEAQSGNSESCRTLACLQFIYLCLTRLHFHLSCTCFSMSGPHNYYQHLVNLFKIVRLNSHIENPPQEDSLRGLLLSFNYVEQPILLSMAITLLPWFYLSIENKSFGLSIEKNLLTYLQRVINLEEHVAWQQAIAQLATMQAYFPLNSETMKVPVIRRLYVRHVSQEIYLLPKPNGPVLFSTLETHVSFSINDFDLRGSFFDRTVLMRIPQEEHSEYLHNDSPLTRRMENADCRFTTWIGCDVYNINVSNSNFSNAYLENLTYQTHVSWHHIRREHLATTPLKFPTKSDATCVTL